MKLHDLHNTVPRQARKRVGRGDGSGHGRTAGRGDKGAGARTGHTNRPYFEGGQIPLIRRLPKRGFKNPNHIEYEVINLAELEELFEAGAVVDAKVLQEAAKQKIEAVGGSCTVIEHPVYNEMERRAARKAAAAAEAKKD